MFGYIYKTTNLVNGKIYIGQHKARKFSPAYLGSGKLITRVVKKYGKENFKVVLIEECDSKEILNQKEIYYIAQYDARNPLIGYNLAEGGNYFSCDYHQGMCGKHQTDKQKEAARNARINYKISNDTRVKMSQSAKKRTLNRITINNKLFIHKGNKQTCIDKCLLDNYLTNGWIKGKIPKSAYTKKLIKEKYSNSIYVKKEDNCILIDKKDLNTYINLGYIIGRNCYPADRGNNISKAKKGKICINNGIQNKYIDPNLLDIYLDDNWVKGRLK